MKTICVTWSYSDKSDYKDHMLYKSFIKNNNHNDLLNIHFNRNNYIDLEKQFNDRFGYQYEFLLYRIFLLKKYLINLNDNIIIFADTNDVVCLGDINEIDSMQIKNIIFSSEQHRYPNENNITNWKPSYLYSESDNNNKNYLNAGLSIGIRQKYIELFEDCISNIFSHEYNNFGGDQGVFTYYYINRNKLIVLDKNTNYFLSTYCRNPDSFLYNNGRIINSELNTKPLFIHDNGWNYGSPKFIERFNLI